jgi:ATP-dependent DNA ligase
MSSSAALFALPLRTPPMEARLADSLPDEPGRWQFEPKWDGFRCLAFKEAPLLNSGEGPENL